MGGRKWKKEYWLKRERRNIMVGDGSIQRETDEVGERQ